MGQQAPKTVEDLDIIVDADAHTWENVTNIKSYIDEGYHGVKDLYLDNKSPNDVFTLNAATPHAFPERLYRSEDHQQGDNYTYENKINEMEDFNIDYSYLTPTLALGINTINNDRAAVAIANGFNNFTVEKFIDDGRVKGAVTVAPQKPNLAAEEIDRLASEEGIEAVSMAMTGLKFGPGHEFYDPIYEAAQDNNLVVTYHPVNSGMTTELPTLYSKCQTWAEQHVFGHMFSNMIGLTSIMFRGVPERFPDLRFVIQEAGLAWAANLKMRLNDHYMEHAEEIPYLQRLPSEYMDDKFYFTTQPLGMSKKPEHLAWMVEIVGPDSIMYSADLPHVDFDPPSELFDRIRSYFGPEQLEKMMGGTAADIFNMR